MNTIRAVFFGLSALSSFSLFGDSIPIETDQQMVAASEQYGDSSKILLKKLRGIHLISASEKASFFPSPTGITQKGLNLTEEQFKKISKLLTKNYIGGKVTTETLKNIKNEIIQFYRSMHHPVVVVQVPEQDVTEGVIVVQILETKLGSITIEGNKWSTKKRIRRYVRLKKNEPIDADVLVSDLAWMNQNPYRNVNAIYKAGEGLGTTDIDLLVQEKTPFSVYAGTDNTGIYETGYERLFAGFNWGKAFGMDHLLSYQYTSSLDFTKFQSHAASYTAPLSWRHTLVVFGGYSLVHAKLQQNTFKNHGESWQVSGRYQIPLRSDRDFLHEISFGLDFKRSNNNVTFGGFNIINHLVNVFQFVAGYEWTYHPETSKTYFEAELYGSPGQLLSDMSPQVYQQLRPGAKPAYLYGRATLDHQHKLPRNFGVDFKLRGQGATCNLLPSEQMGLGGYNTVRGYLERQINVDDALIANLEFRSPSESFFKGKDALSLLVFVDYAMGLEHKWQSYERHIYNLLGYGPGIRYNIQNWLIARLDLGFRAIKTQNDGPPHRFHFSVIANY